MGLPRRALAGALKKLEQLAERVDGDAIAKLSPAERERYDAWVEHTAAVQGGTAAGDPRLVGTILHGPAGEVLNGIAKPPKAAPELEDPGAWEAQRAVERAARDVTRAAYLAPARAEVRFMRVATQRKTQVQDVAHQLAASGLAGRPDVVYGVYRVPDLISAGRLGDETYVEWDVVHAAEGPLPPAAAPAVLSLAADEVLVARAVGERAPLDEDLALDRLAGCGVGPESTLGIARHLANE